MDTNLKTQWKVGVFLATGTMAVLISIALLGADKGLFKSQARLKAHFDQVQGLAQGSVISLSGIVVGNVEKIGFIKESKQLEVILRIDKTFLEYIAADSSVDIRTQGALGDKFLFIIPGDLTKGTIKDGDQINVFKSPDIIGMFTQRGNEAEKVFDILQDVHKITQSIIKDGKLDKVMTNMTLASQLMATSSEHISKSTQNLNFEKLQASMIKLDSILTKVDRGEGSLGALINDPTLHQQLKAMMGGTERKNQVKSLLRNSIEKNESDLKK